MDEAIEALQKLQSAFEDADLDDIVSRIEKLESENEELQDKCDELEAENDELEAENDELEAENDELRARNFATPENAATQLLEEYTGHKPSAGEVGRLKERISEILVSEFGISAGVLP